MSILLLGFIFNLAIARFTKYKYIFLTGHHSFFLACLFSAVLQAANFKGWEMVIIGGFLLGARSAISPAIGQRYTKRVTEDGGIAMGHFGSLGYYLSAGLRRKSVKRKTHLRILKSPKMGLPARYHSNDRYCDGRDLSGVQHRCRFRLYQHHH